MIMWLSVQEVERWGEMDRWERKTQEKSDEKQKQTGNKKERKQPAGWGGGPGPRQTQTPGSESQKFPSCATCFPLGLQTPESSNMAQCLGEKERRGRRRRRKREQWEGCYEGIHHYKKPLRPFIDNQTKARLILALTSTIYTPVSLVSLLFPRAQQKWRLCRAQRQPVILDFPGTQTMGAVGSAQGQWRMHAHVHRWKIHTVTQSAHYFNNSAETWN